MKTMLAFGIIGCISAGMFTGCTSGGTEKISPSNPLIIDASGGSTGDTSPVVTGTPLISNTAKSIAIEAIMQYDLVEDAAITQNGEDLSLVLIVGYSTSEDYAQQLGDNFVRLVKTYSDDGPPQKDIGVGIYNYLIGVYYPNKETLAMGAKVKTAPHITW